MLFKSEIIYGANPFYPECLTILKNKIIHEESTGLLGFMRRRTEIQRKYIHRVIVHKRLLGSDIEILFFGSTAYTTEQIRMKNLTHENAILIADMINV